MVLGLWCALLSLAIGSAYAQERIPDFDVSNAELVQLVNQLYSLDENGAKPGQIRLSYQGHTNTRDNSDNAKDRLFSAVDTSLLRKPVYSQYIAVMNNFYRDAGETEPRVSANEDKTEKSTLLTTIIASKPMQALYQFLNRKGHPYAKDPVTFRFWLAQLWLVNYSRARGKPDTSGFEHVFIGEVKNGEVSGMHNWVRFYTLERDPAANFDYKGFVVKRFNLMAAVKFTWDREMKRSGSMIIGTSPEFDMSLYTLCFLTRRGGKTCDVEVNGCPLSITSYDIVQNRKVYIGSIFPSAGRITDQCRAKNS